jgi:hypothetical protein
MFKRWLLILALPGIAASVSAQIAASQAPGAAVTSARPAHNCMKLMLPG